MLNASRLSWACLVLSVAACSTKNQSADDTSGVATTGGAVYGHTGGAAGVAGNGNTAGVGAGGNGATAGNGTGGTRVPTGGAGTGGSTVCGAALCGPNSCGSTVDYCGSVVDCGFTNCDKTRCGLEKPNECLPCAKIDCQSAGNRNCGPISDGCGGLIDCGTCGTDSCCGCGAAGTPGTPNVCGPKSVTPPSVQSTCIVGTVGCLCDSTAGCAPGLTCDNTQTPNICCSGTNCDLPANRQIGGICTGAGKASCTPGITIPAASGSNDNCGYPAASFNESQFMCGIFATGGGSEPAQIQAYISDEKSMTLGCNQNGYSVTEMQGNPATAYYPSTGDPACADANRRPMRPSLYITDITYDPNCTVGDQQMSGEPYDPTAVFGTWKSATNNTPNADPTGGYNYWNLGPNADLVPTAVNNPTGGTCQCNPPPAGVTVDPTAGNGYNGGNSPTYNNCPGSGRTGKGYSTELRYEAGLISGHSYRLQVIAHDGDQTQGGDSGEACVVFCAGGDTGCQTKTCADLGADACGPQGDGCGGILDCGPCHTACQPLTCEQACPPDTNGKVACISAYDVSIGAIVACPTFNGCSSVMTCYCVIG